MKQVKVYRNDILAGILSQENRESYTFIYDEAYFMNPNFPAISLTLPKNKQMYQSKYLFPFFFNMLAEGVNKALQCWQLKIDEKDYFSLLIATAQYNTIGVITVKPKEYEKNRD